MLSISSLIESSLFFAPKGFNLELAIELKMDSFESPSTYSTLISSLSELMSELDE